MPIGCLLTASPIVLLVVAALVVLGGGFAYYNLNVDLFGIGAPDFHSFVVSPDFQNIPRSDGSQMKVSFEKPSDSVFAGLVRHVTPIREAEFPILTHDILVTSGDYADSKKVDTSVFNHHFFWHSASINPQGTINLLHTVPLNEAIYKSLLEVQTGQTVRITGREIYRIEVFKIGASQPDRWWEDTGCNSLVVDSVAIVQP